MLLKKATPLEVKELQQICLDAYTLNFSHHWNKGGLDWYLKKEFSIKRLKADVTTANSTYYFIKHKMNTVGFIKISNISSNTSLEIEKIYVLPKNKGMGIGQLALKEIFKIAVKAGKKEIQLGVIDTNLSAIAFYEKLGFKFHSKTKLDLPYFKDELKGMHRMVKELK